MCGGGAGSQWGALRPATQAAMLALIQSKQLRATGGSASYAAQLFNYAKYQIDYVLGDSGRSWLVGYGTGCGTPRSVYPRCVAPSPPFPA